MSNLKRFLLMNTSILHVAEFLTCKRLVCSSQVIQNIKLQLVLVVYSENVNENNVASPREPTWAATLYTTYMIDY